MNRVTDPEEFKRMFAGNAKREQDFAARINLDGRRSSRGR